MRRQNPDHQRDIPISMAVHWQLVGASIRTGFQKEDWEIAAEAIDEWVRRHDPEGVPMAPTRGYQWKGLFLPDGTMLRTVFGGTNYHCQVENDHILFNGQVLSPSGFINAVGGVRRNAWRSTWILRPEDKHWVLADTVRTPAPRPRKRTAPSQPGPASTTPPHTERSTATPAPDPVPAQTEPAEPAEPATSRQVDPPSTRPARQNSTQAGSTTAQEPDRRRHIGATPPPVPCACERERRINADHRQSSSLRDELLRLLSRTQPLQQERHQAGARRTGPARQH